MIYGWKDDTTLKVFDEIGLDHLYETEQVRLSVCSLLHVADNGLKADSFTVMKTKYKGPENRPEEVVKVLGY